MDQSVCIADWWSPARSLADIFVEIGDMLQMRKYNVQSPLNAQAAEWSVINESTLPIGQVDLGITDVVISLGKVITQNEER
jgi:hypothetical protein